MAYEETRHKLPISRMEEKISQHILQILEGKY